MINKLQQCFSTLQTKEELLDKIHNNTHLLTSFNEMNKQNQDIFLEICTGERGLKILYDVFFKEIFHPLYHPERLEELLSLLLKMPVKILEVLPNESNSLSDDKTMLIMDIVIRLGDGSIANVECQKNGYFFPGQRAACYSADLLMRHYRRIKSEYKNHFSYRNIKKVYSIVFYEYSPSEFRQVSTDYIHYSRQAVDTGVKIDLLQEYVFISLDTFRAIYHNKHNKISSPLEAWLLFLSSDKVEDITQLLTAYPRFIELYKDIGEICYNTERMMHMFSKELIELDRNTVQLMIDQLQEMNDSILQENASFKQEIIHLKAILDRYGIPYDNSID